jgi:hypothetical protein
MKTSGQLRLLLLQGDYLLKLRLFLAGFLATLGSLVGSYQTSLAQRVEVKADTGSVPSISSTVSAASSSELINSRSLSNGVYLYGESAKPEQIQQEYFIFEVNNHRVVGAFYMPHSSYDCFYGALEAGNLDLNIINTYDEVTYTHSVNLQDYQPISSVSSNDQQILSACKAVYQVQVLSDPETTKPFESGLK